MIIKNFISRGGPTNMISDITYNLQIVVVSSGLIFNFQECDVKFDVCSVQRD